MNKKFFIILIFSAIIISFILGTILLNKIGKNKIQEISNIPEQTIDKKENEQIILSTDKKYYLHKSNFEIPERNIRYIAQMKALKGLTDERKEYIKENFRYTHMRLERDLMSSVNVLKDINSPYWESYTKAGTYQSLDGYDTYWESDGGFSRILENIQNYANELQNETAKNDLGQACKLLKEGIDNHDLSKFFEAHEIIHDYDYWILSVEPSFVTFSPEDWEGTRTYFGKSALIEEK